MKEFFKTGRFRVLLVVGCLLFSFLLRSIYTGGLMPLLSSAGGMLMVPLNSMSAAAGAAIQNRFGPFLSSGEVHRENQALRGRYSGWRSS